MKNKHLIKTMFFLVIIVISLARGSNGDSIMYVITYPYAEIPIDLENSNEDNLIRDIGASLPGELQLAIFEILHKISTNKLIFLDRSSLTSMTQSIDYENVTGIIDGVLKIVSKKPNAFLFTKIENLKSRPGWVIIRAKLVNLSTIILAEKRVEIPTAHVPDSLNYRIKSIANDLLNQLDIIPHHPPSISQTNSQTNLGTKIWSISLATGTISSFAVSLIFNEKARDQRKDVPIKLSEEKVDAWGNYIKYQTRADWYGWTALHLGISTLPFAFDWADWSPRTNKWILASLFFASSITFGTYGVISGEKANDAYEKLNTIYFQLSEERVIYKGKYENYREMEKILYLNAAIDLVSAMMVLLYYNGRRANKLTQIYPYPLKSGGFFVKIGNNWSGGFPIVFTLQMYL